MVNFVCYTKERLSIRNMGVVIRQSIKGTIVNYVGVLLGVFVQFFIVTKYLDPEVIGLTKVVYEVALLCSSFALLGSGSAGMRFFPYFRDEDKSKHNNGFFFFFLLLPTVGCTLMSVVYTLCKNPIESFFGKNSALFADFSHWVLPLMVILTFWQFFETYCNINLRIVIPKAVREVGMRALMLVLYLLYGFNVIDIAGLVGGMVLCYGLCLLATGAYAMRTGDYSLKHDWKFIDPELRSRILKYEAFIVVAAISGNIMNQLDLFMLSSVRGLYSGGVYTIVLYIAAVVDMPTRSITAISSPLAARSLKEGNFEEANSLYKKVSVHQLLASSLLLLLIWINLDSLFSIIPNGDKFAEGRYAILFLGLTKVINSAIGFGNTLISFSRYYYWTLFITLFLTILTICTNLYFIPLYGLSGAALATLITCLVSGTYQQYLVQRKVHGNPFTKEHLKIALTVALLYGLSLLIPSMSGISVWLDLVVRSGAVAIAGGILIYMLKISPQINGAIDSFLLKLKI